MDLLLVCCMPFPRLDHKEVYLHSFLCVWLWFVHKKSRIHHEISLLRHLCNRVVASVCSSLYLMQNTKAKLDVLLKDAVPHYFLDESELSQELQGISESKSYPSKEIVHYSFFLVLERLKTFEGPPLYLPCILSKQTLLSLSCFRLLERYLDFFDSCIYLGGLF